MQAPAIPSNEAERLADLYDYGVLDTPMEKAFNEFAELAAVICGTQYGAVTLVDSDRQWFKAEYGIVIGQTPRDESVCGHAILAHEVFEVPDTERDERFANNPVLQSAGIRFYCGSQLRSGRGHAIGMLCVLDSEPRQLSATQKHSLSLLAGAMMAVLEAGRQSRLLNWFGALVDTVSDEIMVTEPATLRYLYANASAVRSLGYSLEQLCRMSPVDVMEGQNHLLYTAYVQQLRDGAAQVVFEGMRQRSDGSTYPVEARWQMVSSFGRPVILSIVTDITKRKEVERMKSEFISVVSHVTRLVVSASLEGPQAAFALRPRGGKPQVTDGPYAEAKEMVGGFFIIEAVDREEAVRVASLHPAATLGESVGWGIELHPIGFFEMTPST